MGPDGDSEGSEQPGEGLPYLPKTDDANGQ